MSVMSVLMREGDMSECMRGDECVKTVCGCVKKIFWKMKIDWMIVFIAIVVNFYVFESDFSFFLRNFCVESVWLFCVWEFDDKVWCV